MYVYIDMYIYIYTYPYYQQNWGIELYNVEIGHFWSMQHDNSWCVLSARADTIVCPQIIKTPMYLNIHVVTCYWAKHDNTSSTYIHHTNTNPIWTHGKLYHNKLSFSTHIPYQNHRNMSIRITWSSILKHTLLEKSKHDDISHHHRNWRIDHHAWPTRSTMI